MSQLWNLLRVSSLALCLGAPALAHARHAIKPEPHVRIHGTVLLGSPSTFSGVAVVNRREVFLRIPAYQSIVREKLSRRSPRYHFLLKQANDVFRGALEQLAGQNRCDLVVESGGVSAQGVTVLDLTGEMVQAVQPERVPASRKPTREVTAPR